MKTFRKHFTGGIRECKYVPVNRNSERRLSPRFVPLSDTLFVMRRFYHSSLGTLPVGEKNYCSRSLHYAAVTGGSFTVPLGQVHSNEICRVSPAITLFTHGLALFRQRFSTGAAG